MTTTEQPPHDLSERAARHLWMHFTRLAGFTDHEVPVIVRGEGCYVYDQHGNLHEWVDDPDGTFRGGFYVDTSLNGPGCLYATTAHDVAHWDYSTGFRCCGDP